MVGYVKFLLFTYYQLWGLIIIYLGDAMEIDEWRRLEIKQRYFIGIKFSIIIVLN